MMDVLSILDELGSQFNSGEQRALIMVVKETKLESGHCI